MRKNFVILAAILVAQIATACTTKVPADTARRDSPLRQSATLSSPSTATPPRAGSHAHAASASDVPAFQTDAASLKSLRPTLSPERFSGKTSAAYKVVKEIPRIIAQLPCYCHCDKGYGHKSLYSCFEDDHAAHCAVCVDEALLALRLEKVEKLNPDQIRERIIAQYSTVQ